MGATLASTSVSLSDGGMGAVSSAHALLLDGSLAAGYMRMSDGFYAGCVMSEDAAALLRIGRQQRRRVHEARRVETYMPGVIVSIGTNAEAGVGGPLLYSTKLVTDSTVTLGASGSDGLALTFVESLRLPLADLELLASGTFFYLVPQNSMFTSVYSLRPVPHAEINPQDYFTVSKDGVTHVRVCVIAACSAHTCDHRVRLCNALACVVHACLICLPTLLSVARSIKVLTVSTPRCCSLSVSTACTTLRAVYPPSPSFACGRRSLCGTSRYVW